MEGSRFDFGGYKHTKENAVIIKRRREKIIQMRESGVSFEEIAKSFGISKSRCRKIYSTAIQKPKSLKIASSVREVLKSYLPLLILKDGSFIKMNYPLLFLILESKNDYFKTNNAKTYVRLIVHSSRPELILLYNKLLAKFGEKILAEKWIRSDSAIVPKCFWNNKETEDFLLKCSYIKKVSTETFKEIIALVEEIVKSSPNFDIKFQDLFETSKPSDLNSDFGIPDPLLREIEDLEGYVSIIKSDESLKREDYISILDSALSCLSKVKELSQNGSIKPDNAEPEPGKIEQTQTQTVSKPKPKAFWPKPNF